MIIKDIDNSNIALREIAELRNTEIQVGFFGDKGAHLPMIAGVNEFGAFVSSDTAKRKKALAWLFIKMKEAGIPIKKGAGGGKAITIPERPFFRKALDDPNTIKKANDNALKAFDKSGDLKTVPYAIGDSFVASIQSSIASNIQPANHPLTTELKGGKNTTLAGLGQGVTFKVL